jgi:hypothetical protein
MTEKRKEKVEKLDVLLGELDFPALYMGYGWKSDTWERGFPDILRLEMEVKEAAQKNSIGRHHLIEIAEWGGLPNKERIYCPEPLKITLYNKVGLPESYVYDEPDHAVSIVQSQVKGYGPTYISKLLRFASPESFGAIDTRLVRVFGHGDRGVHKIHILNLIAEQTGGRWAISKMQKGWPTEYGTWVNSLRYLASALNSAGIKCPHPRSFVESGLRSNDNKWLPADVEMALFAYASQRINGY